FCLSVFVCFFFMLPLPPRSPLFPYTTLFRSRCGHFFVAAAAGSCPQPRHRPGVRAAAPARQPPRLLLRPAQAAQRPALPGRARRDRKSTRLNSSHVKISYAVFCLKKKKEKQQ